MAAQSKRRRLETDLDNARSPSGASRSCNLFLMVESNGIHHGHPTYICVLFMVNMPATPSFRASGRVGVVSIFAPQRHEEAFHMGTLSGRYFD